MTTLVQKMIHWFQLERKTVNPVTDFFVRAKVGEKKKKYTEALKKAQKDQETILRKYETLKK